MLGTEALADGFMPEFISSMWNYRTLRPENILKITEVNPSSEQRHYRALGSSLQLVSRFQFNSRAAPSRPPAPPSLPTSLQWYSPSGVNPQLFESCLQAFLFSTLSFSFHYWDGQKVTVTTHCYRQKQRGHEHKVLVKASAAQQHQNT